MYGFLPPEKGCSESDRTGATEEYISSLEDSVHPLSVTVHDTTSEMAALRAKLDDLENRSCRNNLSFVGFPECAEGFTLHAPPQQEPLYVRL